MTEIQMGPYRDVTIAHVVARAFINLGEAVRVIESYEPYQRKGNQYSAVVIRGESA